MAVNTRAIRRRIKSVTNTRKITKAMELVAASKMRKAVGAVLGTRPYAELAWHTVLSVSAVTDTTQHPLLRKPDEVRRVLLVLITSDRGLAGGFNGNMVRRTLTAVRDLGSDVEIEVLTIGRRGADAMRRAKQNVVASFTNITNNPRYEEVLPIGRMIVEDFKAGKYDKVILAYTDFISTITQKPHVLELLPLGTPEQMKELGATRQTGSEASEEHAAREYTFEPSPIGVLDRMLPRLVETMVYQAVLESAASEHSARMMAMRSASDAANDMIDSLSFTYNQARQASITQEIAEISSGKAALEN